YHLRNLSNSNPFDKWTGNGKNYVYISQCGNVHAPADFTIPSLRNLNTGSTTVYTTIPWYISDNIGKNSWYL
ncbi:MAG: hypothetical protein FWD78_16895, partial [Treponema sp.]|nr:hypothetical protein [Treponema sp.]